MKKTILFIALSGLLAGLGACKKFVNAGPPQSEVESVNVFADDQATLSAALGVYANMGLSNLNICAGGATLYPALSADELTYNSSNSELLSFQNDQVLAGNGTGIYSRLWVPAYSTIYTANAILEGVAASKTLSRATSDQVTGEMLVTRALNYFYLAGLFGDVPLLLTTNYKVNAVAPRTPVSGVYRQLRLDLVIADSLLSPAYPAGGNLRPNKWAADALLARIALYQNDWAMAEKFASAVINSGQYQLEKDPAGVFSSASAETIWQLGNDYHNTADASTFVPFSAAYVPSYSISAFLLAAFEPTDLRLSNWIGKAKANGQSYAYPFKYKDRNYEPVTEYEVILRLAELYLIRAEARARQGDPAGAAADINLIRQRAGLVATSAGTAAQLLDTILAENEKEFFCEWGHRWLDLKRTGKADSVLSAEKPAYWQPYASNYPIPLSELQNNPALKQNPGY